MLFSMYAGPWDYQSALIDEEKFLSFEERIDKILLQRRAILDPLEIKGSYLNEMVIRFLFAKSCIQDKEYEKAKKEIINVRNLTAFVDSATTAESCNNLLERIEALKSGNL